MTKTLFLIEGWMNKGFYASVHPKSEYIEAENEARAKKLGLWNDTNPMPPWVYRKMKRGR